MIDAAGFSERVHLLDCTDGFDREHQFKMMVPDGLTPSLRIPQLAPPGPFQPLVRYGEATGRYGLGVSYMESALEVNPLDWAVIQAETVGASPRISSSYPTRWGIAGEFETRIGSGEQRLSHAFRDGRRHFLVEFCCPAAEAHERVQVIRRCLGSFTPTYTGLEPDVLVERIVPLESRKSVAPRLTRDWSVRIARENQEGMVTILDHLPEGVPRARIFVISALRSEGVTGPDFAMQHFTRLRTDGFTLDSGVLFPLLGSEGERPAWTSGVTGQRDGLGYALTTAVVEDERLYILAGLVGPARRTSPEEWAVNNRAYQLVLGALRTA